MYFSCSLTCVRCRSSIPRGINEGRRTPDPTEMGGEGRRGNKEQEGRVIEQRMYACVLPLPSKGPNKSILVIRLHLFSSSNMKAVSSVHSSPDHIAAFSLFSGSCCCSRWIDVPFSQYSFSEGERGNCHRRRSSRRASERHII